MQNLQTTKRYRPVQQDTQPPLVLKLGFWLAYGLTLFLLGFNTASMILLTS